MNHWFIFVWRRETKSYEWFTAARFYVTLKFRWIFYHFQRPAALPKISKMCVNGGGKRVDMLSEGWILIQIWGIPNISMQIFSPCSTIFPDFRLFLLAYRELGRFLSWTQNKNAKQSEKKFSRKIFFMVTTQFLLCVPWMCVDCVSWCVRYLRIVITQEVELIKQKDKRAVFRVFQSNEFTREGNFALIEIFSNRRNSSEKFFRNCKQQLQAPSAFKVSPKLVRQQR